jgi:FIMAH domain-containing protein/beta-propeller repeat-containing protein
VDGRPDFYGATVTNIAMGASASSTVYISTTFGSAATDDGGISWRQAGPGNTSTCFAVDPLVPTIVYSGASMSPDVFVSRISADGSSLEYSTYLGGTGSDSGSDIAVDPTGAAYIVGITQSEDFPVLNAFQSTAGGLMDVFVAKLSEFGTLAYSTYLAGNLSDYNPRVAVDAFGQAHVVGITLSANFLTAHAYQPSIGGGYGDVFLTTLNAAGTGLVYSTFLGGNDQEVDMFGAGVATTPSGDTVVTGTTRSQNFPTRDAVQPVLGGGADAFVARFDSTGGLRYSTFLGGSGDDFGRQVAVDPTGSVVVVGSTASTDFPTRLALQPANAGAQDIFIARIDDGSAPVDTTAPSTSVAISGTSGSNGWYRSAVQITLAAADNAGGSGVAFVEYSVNNGAYQRYVQPVSIANEGSTIIRARATDRAGNVENPSLTTVRIDSAAPTITITSPAGGDYLHSNVLHLSFAAVDGVSGLAGGSPSATFDGSPVPNGQDIQLLDVSLGSHALIVSASDSAGNATTQTIAIRVTATIDSLIGAVNVFAARGQITARIARNLLSKLSDAKTALQGGKVAAARSKLLDFRSDVVSHNGTEIAADAARVLITDVDDVLARM